MSDEDVVVRQLYNDKWKSPPNAYRLNVGLIGPVNSGKSELMAKLGHKVTAVSPKSHTTDEIVSAFRSWEVEADEGIRNVQVKYLDSPGLMRNKTGYLSKGWKVLREIDFSLLVVDSSKKFDDLLQESIRRLEKHRDYEKFMKALVLNKVDLVENKRKFHGLIAEVERYGKFDKIFYTSALTGYGVQEIEGYLKGMARPGKWECPKEVKSQSSELEVAEELMRESLFHRAYHQVPYSTMVECESIADKSDGSQFVQFRFHVEDENVQRMLIGKRGRNINWMRDRFKVEWAKLKGKEVEVHVRVVIRRKVMKADMEHIESAYYDHETKRTMQIYRDHLIKKGKFLPS